MQNVTIGATVREARLRKGLTQEGLATKIRKSKSFISDIEANRYTPSYATLRNIALVLNLNPFHLDNLKREGLKSNGDYSTASKI